jgi:hypothetical protein
MLLVTIDLFQKNILNSLYYYVFSDVAVVHALNVRRAIQQENYFSFFHLYKTTPNMGNYILDMAIDTWRLYALQRICKGFKPNIAVSYAISLLAFSNNKTGIEFLLKAGCVIIGSSITMNNNDSSSSINHLIQSYDLLEINTKDTVIDASAVFTQDKLLL